MGGAAAAIWTTKQIAMTISSTITKASRKRKPLFISSRSRNTSSAAMSAPPINGMPNSSCSAMAVPITSARSQAMIAASQASHSRKLTGLENTVATGLREIAAGGDAEPRRERLQQDRHQVGEQDHRQQRVAELRTAGESRRPVAGIHVADRDHVAGTGKGKQPPDPEATLRHGHRGMDLGQARSNLFVARCNSPRGSQRPWGVRGCHGLSATFECRDTESKADLNRNQYAMSARWRRYRV